MRRRPGALLAIELEILTVAMERSTTNGAEFHGFELAKLIADSERSGKLLAHGTLYKALNRLASAGLLSSVWEDADAALAAGRPRRRLYRVTVSGEHAVAAAVTEQRGPARPARLGLEPT